MEISESRKPRVVLVNRWFHPEVAGGAETSLYELARALRTTGADVTVFCQARRIPAGLDEYDNFVVYRRPAPRLPRQAWPVAQWVDVIHESFWLRKIADIGPDAIIARTFFSALAARIAFPSVRTIYWCPGSRSEWFGRFPPGTVKSRKDRLWAAFDKAQSAVLEYCAHLGADVVVAEAGHVAKDLAERLGVPKAKIQVRRNGVDLGRFSPRQPDRALLSELDLPPDMPMILTVGRLEAMKNQGFLLRAFARMQQRASLVIVGKGADAEQLKQLARDLGVADRTRFAGFRSDVERFYTTATVFVLPSIYEPYGNVFSEALACGTPTIGLRPTSTVCVPTDEHVVDDCNGYLVDGANDGDLSQKLDVLVSNPKIRARMSTSARNLAVERYNWSQTARGFLDDMFPCIPAPENTR